MATHIAAPPPPNEALEHGLVERGEQAHVRGGPRRALLPAVARTVRAGRLREEVTEFKQNLAIVIALASKALDRRHWEMLSDVVASKTEAEGVEKVRVL